MMRMTMGASKNTHLGVTSQAATMLRRVTVNTCGSVEMAQTARSTVDADHDVALT